MHHNYQTHGNFKQQIVSWLQEMLQIVTSQGYCIQFDARAKSTVKSTA